jgi:hypothetical protein
MHWIYAWLYGVLECDTVVTLHSHNLVLTQSHMRLFPDRTANKVRCSHLTFRLIRSPLLSRPYKRTTVL